MVAPRLAARFVVNVEALVVRDGRYCTIVRGANVPQAPGGFGFPGGKMEADAGDDALEATARRELWEEVGVEVGPEMAYVESHLFVADDGTPVLDVVMLCQWAAGEGHPAAPEEVAAVAWLTAEEILADRRTMPWTAGSLRRAEEVRRARGW